MANIVLVTKQCYLLCESINFISVHEMSESEKDDSMFYLPPLSRRRRRKKTAAQKKLEKQKKEHQLYHITIDFVPAHTPQNNNQGRNSHTGNCSVAITVRGYDRCIDLYTEMLGQIREQQPDKLFLEKMVEKFLNDSLEEAND